MTNDVLETIQDSFANGKPDKGTPSITSTPGYLNNKSVLRLNRMFKVAAEKYADIDVGYQFWELFLSNGIYATQDKRTTMGSHDRLAVSVVLMPDASGQFKFNSKASLKHREFHTEISSYKKIHDEIYKLINLNRQYQSGNYHEDYDSHLYEYFRYFCLNTYVLSIISPTSYGFNSNGITSFFRDLVLGHHDIYNYTEHFLETKTNTPTSQQRKTLSEIYIGTLKYSFDDIANTPNYMSGSVEHNAVTFLKSLIKHADDFVLAVLRAHQEMSLTALKIFYSFSSNIYSPWMVSSSKAPVYKSGPYPSHPFSEIAFKAGKIDQNINIPSFHVYNRLSAMAPIYDTVNFIKKNKSKGSSISESIIQSQDNLGCMLINPFDFSIVQDHTKLSDTDNVISGAKQALGTFKVSGFFRLMNRFSVSQGKRIVGDEYIYQTFENDRDQLEPFFNFIVEEMALYLGTPEFLSNVTKPI